MAVVSRIVVRNSDLSGAEGAETVSLDIANVLRDVAKSFGKITLDLTPAEAENIDSVVADAMDNLRADLENGLADVFAAHAAITAAGAGTTGGAGEKGSTGTVDPRRVWARQNGFTIGDRGRIAAEIVEAYEKANPGKITNLDTDTAGESWDNSTEGDDRVTDGPSAADLAKIDAEDAASV